MGTDTGFSPPSKTAPWRKALISPNSGRTTSAPKDCSRRSAGSGSWSARTTWAAAPGSSWRSRSASPNKRNRRHSSRGPFRLCFGTVPDVFRGELVAPNPEVDGCRPPGLSQMSLTDSAREVFSKVEVLRDLESTVRAMMEEHEKKRQLWFPSDLIGAAPDEGPLVHRAEMRKRAAGIPDHARAALALNTLTEEGLPHFHRILATHLGDDSHWRAWNNLWTAEEDRHGQVLHDYVHDTGLFSERRFEEMQFEYLKAGFHPSWDQDPYRVFVYTTVQERATQHSHAMTGHLAATYEPTLGSVLDRIAREEARHFAFYRTIFAEILKRDPDQALHSASFILPAIDMPGVTIPGFRELADVIRRSGIYGPRDYLRIVQEQVKYWRIDTLTGLNELGRKAQEKILGIPERLRRIAEAMETRSRSKTFAFDVVFNREFVLE